MKFIVLLIFLILACGNEPQLTRSENSHNYSISIDLSDSANVFMDIANRYDTVVRHINYGKLGYGYQELFWDGKNNEGLNVLPGIYFIRVSIDGEKYSYTRQIWISDPR